MFCTEGRFYLTISILTCLVGGLVGYNITITLTELCYLLVIDLRRPNPCLLSQSPEPLDLKGLEKEILRVANEIPKDVIKLEETEEDQTYWTDTTVYLQVQNRLILS